jgi:hypothetical protein
VFEYLFKSIQYQYNLYLKDQFKTFDKFTRDYLNDKELLFYPALLIEIKPLQNNYLLNKITTGILNIDFHIISENIGSYSSNSNYLEKTVNHFNNIELVNLYYDGISKSKLLSGITVDENYYSFGSLERYKTTNNQRTNQLIHTIISYKCNFYDDSYNNVNKTTKKLSSFNLDLKKE